MNPSECVKIPPQKYLHLLLAFMMTCLGFSGWAQEMPPKEILKEIELDINIASELWREGDTLGVQAMAAMRGSTSNSSDAIKLLESRDKAYETAERIYRQIQDKDKGHPRGLAEYGRFLVSRQRYAEAGLKIETALMGARSKKAFKDPERGYLLGVFAGILQRGGSVRRAANLFQRAFELLPDDPRARISLAVARCDQGAYAKASALLKSWNTPTGRTLALSDSVRALGIYTLAFATEMQGQPEEALAIYREAYFISRKAKGERTQVSVQARGALRRLKQFTKELNADERTRTRYAQAFSLCRDGLRARELAIQDRDAFKAAREQWIEAFSEEEQKEARELAPIKKMQEAMEFFQEALQAYSSCSKAHMELARCHLYMDEIKSARAHFDAAAVYNPLNTPLLAELGTINLMLGNWDDAKTSFEKLLSLHPDFAPAYTGLATAKIKQRASAKDLYQALNALDRADRLGGRRPQTVKSRHEARTLLATLSRDGRLPSLPRPITKARPRKKKSTKWSGSGSILDY